MKRKPIKRKLSPWTGSDADWEAFKETTSCVVCGGGAVIRRERRDGRGRLREITALCCWCDVRADLEKLLAKIRTEQWWASQSKRVRAKRKFK